ncbi:MAG: CHAT domain-containing protein [Armatimonadetes bacterium]|nr:CHAT domain-containing protein [Armatimonadota bacterium]
MYAPSATVLHNLRQLWDGRPALAYEGEFVGFGDLLFGEGDAGDEQRAAARWFASRGLSLAPLPGTRVEVERIAERFAGRAAVYLQQEATEWRAKQRARGYRYVHFATHGLLDDRNPLYSGLAFSPPLPDEPAEADDLLQVWEMFGLRLDAELVVLSACQTGLGAVRGGEGLVGMSRALFFAGARCLVVSLWNVPDVPTAQLMQWFYEELGSGRSVVEALRGAKARMRIVERDPYYWAAFVPIGLGW